MDTITNQGSITYDYKIDPNGTVASKTIQSNVESTNLITAKLDMVKTVDKTYATIGDTLNYTVTLTNNGNILLSDINFTDILPTGATFVTGSVKIDNVSQPTYNIATGFSLGSMILLAKKTVTFQATVSSLPSPNTLINKAAATYSYLIGSLITGSSQSNNVTTTVNVTNVTVAKSADVADAEVGDEITYTFVITNTGNIDATNIRFTDTLASNLKFIADSVTINGTTQASYDPNTGFTLPNITPTSNVTVKFKATVI